MALEPPRTKGATAAAGEKKADGGAGAAARQFAIPPGYAAHYLDRGRNVDFVKLRATGKLGETAEKQGPNFLLAYGEWLHAELGLTAFLPRHGALAPQAERQPIVERLGQLTPFDRRALVSVIEARGDGERIAKALGPDGMARLAQSAPPPAHEAQPHDGEPKPEHQPDGERAAEKKTDEPKKKDGAPESKGRFQGGSVFDRLFAAPLEHKKAHQPESLLAELERLDERAFAELAQVIEARTAWQPIAELVGPRFAQLLGRKAYHPLERALAAHPDGPCAPDERARLMGLLARAGAFETRALKQAIEERGATRALTVLLGREVVVWLGGDPDAAQKKEPDDEPAAALAAAVKLKPPSLRRVLEKLRAGAAGPALVEALGEELDAFVNGYWDSVRAPDPKRRRTSKEPLQALARADVARLRALAQAAARPGEEPAEIEPGITSAQLEAILKPLLTGAQLTPESRATTLKALEALPLVELDRMIARVPPDGMAAIETTLGPRFTELARTRYYQPLADALAAHRPDGELPEAEKTKILRPLVELGRWAQARLAEAVLEHGRARELSALFGAALKKLGLEAALAGARSRPKLRADDGAIRRSPEGATGERRRKREEDETLQDDLEQEKTAGNPGTEIERGGG